jgi:hypothetical protein
MLRAVTRAAIDFTSDEHSRGGHGDERKGRHSGKQPHGSLISPAASAALAFNAVPSGTHERAIAMREFLALALTLLALAGCAGALQNGTPQSPPATDADSRLHGEGGGGGGM